MADASSDSAMSTVLAIAELREAILVAYGYANMEQLADPDQEPGPVVQLFPLQRVSRSFAATIRESPELRTLMCVSEVTAMDPLRWFLRTLNMDLDVRPWGRNEEIYDIYRIHANGGKENWVIPNSWEHEDASWRKIKRKITSHDGAPRMSLHFVAYNYNRSWGETLSCDALPTLGDVNCFVEEALLHFRDEITRYIEHVEYERATKAENDARRAQEDCYRVANIEEGRKFPAWCAEQRQREYEVDEAEHQSICNFCNRHCSPSTSGPYIFDSAQ